MVVSNISPSLAISAALAQKEATNHQEMQISVFKKALDAQTQSALSLIETLPNIPSKGLPSNLGNTINTTA